MKKRLSKQILKRKKANTPVATRITNDTVAEHREKILAGGRRYKYPMQYARHKLVINALLIALAAFGVLIAIGYWQLYSAHNSSTFFYRITRIAPLPIASVDGESALYSDYLVNYRAAEHYLSKFDEIKPDSEDGKLQLRYKQRESLDTALADAHARRIAREHKLSVANSEVEAIQDSMRIAANGQLTKEVSRASSQRVLGLDGDDLQVIIKNSLLRSKAAFAVDDKARKIKDNVSILLTKHGNDFDKVAQSLNTAKNPDQVTAGISGLINNSTSFGGISASQVAKLEKGKVSKPIQSVTMDGYYFVKLVEKTDTQVSFAFLHIPLKEFAAEIKALKEQGKVKEYINIDLPKQQPARKD